MENVLLTLAILAVVAGAACATIGLFAEELRFVMYSIAGILGGTILWAFSEALRYLKIIARRCEHLGFVD